MLQAELAPIRARRKAWEQRLPEVCDILRQGSRAAAQKAERTLQDVRRAMRIDYFEDNHLLR